MHRYLLGVGIAVGLALAAGCGGSQSSVTCGQGTVLRGGTCLSAVTCGAGTELVDGKCVVMRDNNQKPADDPVADFQAIVDRACACKDEPCIESAMAELTQLGQKYADADPNDFGESTTQKLGELSQKFAVCAQEIVARSAPSDPPPPDDGFGDPTQPVPAKYVVGVKECDSIVEDYHRCDKLPTEARNAFRQGAENWKQVAESGKDGKKALAEACKQARAATDETLKAFGCKS